jgi:hypothetical protein
MCCSIRLALVVALSAALEASVADAAGNFNYMLQGHDSLEAQNYISLCHCDQRLPELDLGGLFCSYWNQTYGGPLDLIMGSCTECNGVWGFWDRGDIGIIDGDPGPRYWRLGVFYGNMDEAGDTVLAGNQSWRHSQVYCVGSPMDESRIFMGVYNIGRDVDIKIPVPWHGSSGFTKELGADLFFLHNYVSAISYIYDDLSAWGKLETLTGILTDTSTLEGMPVLKDLADDLAGKTDWDYWFRVSCQARLSYEMGVPGDLIQAMYEIPDLADHHPAAIAMREACEWFIGFIPTPSQNVTWGTVKSLFR